MTPPEGRHTDGSVPVDGPSRRTPGEESVPAGSRRARRADRARGTVAGSSADALRSVGPDLHAHLHPDVAEDGPAASADDDAADQDDATDRPDDGTDRPGAPRRRSAWSADPVLPSRGTGDGDAAWGDARGGRDDDERFLREVPPHW